MLKKGKELHVGQFLPPLWPVAGMGSFQILEDIFVQISNSSCGIIMPENLWVHLSLVAIYFNSLVLSNFDPVPTWYYHPS